MTSMSWNFELDVEDARGFKRRVLEVGEDGGVALGGPQSVLQEAQAHVELRVLPGGTLEATALGPRARLQGEPFARACLGVGQVLSVGEARATLHVPPHLKGQSAAPGCQRWQLALEGQGEGRSHGVTLVRATGLMFSFGRVDLNALRLPIESLARRHVGLFIDASGQLWAKDLGSPPGTWLGDARLDRWAPIPAGAVLRAGQATLTASVPTPVAGRP